MPPGKGRQRPQGKKVSVADAEKALVSVEEAARLCEAPIRTIRDRCNKGKYPGTIEVNDNGGKQYRIPVPSLPLDAQKKYYREQMEKENPPEADRARTEAMNRLNRQQARAAAEAGQPIKPEKFLPVRLNQDESNEAWRAWEQATEGQQREALKRVNALVDFFAMERAGRPVGDIAKEIEAKHGASYATLWRWRNLVANQDQSDWAVLLLPKWKGKTVKAEFSEEAREYIKETWASQSKPTIAAVYRQATELGKEKGWKIPSCDVVERFIRALPHGWKTYRRGGDKALESLYPHQRRDYSQLRVHDIWCTDGRKADVICRWQNPDGSFTMGRPIIVGWADVRTRYLLGFEIGRTESADLVRLAFKNALENARVIPEEALMDNGRGFASKQMTGGAKTRYRFKVKEEEVQGVLTLMGVNVIWATPGHGQAKPIESFWRTLSEMDKRAEFRGAYVGNCPDARPEEWDPKKAVPIEEYRKVLVKELDAYHQRGHRGDSMNGRSPLEVFTALKDSGPPRKQPTAQQLRMCLLAAETAKIGKTTGTIKVLGNHYKSDAFMDLDRSRTYTVRFNPEDASQPVYVYDGNRLLCEATLHGKTGFRDKEAGREHQRARQKALKGQKQLTEGLREMSQASSWAVKENAGQPKEPAETHAAPPTPKTAQPLRTTINIPRAEPQPEKKEAGPQPGLLSQRIRALSGENP